MVLNSSSKLKGPNWVIPIRAEKVLKLSGRVDVDGHAQAQHGGVLAVKDESAVDHADENAEIGGIPEVASHALKHPGDELCPNVFVELV